MTDSQTGEELHQAIIDDPGCDTRRLVYADWLDENGGDVPCGYCGGVPERPGWRCTACSGGGRVSDGRRGRAEFVRVQCELEPLRNVAEPRVRMVPKEFGGMRQEWSGNRELWQRAESLRRRERELWEYVWPTIWDYLKPHLPVGTTILDRRPTKLDCSGGFVFAACRGFVAEVRLPLAAWVGGPCSYCGDNWRRPVETCDYCRGSGRTPALGPVLARSLPLWPEETAVRFGDREPDTIGDEFCWVMRRDGLDDRGACLPGDLFGLLAGGKRESGGPAWAAQFGVDDEWVIYPTHGAAHAACSAAALKWAMAQKAAKVESALSRF